MTMTRRMSAYVALFGALILAPAVVRACDGSIPSGDGCIHGTTDGPGSQYGPIYLCGSGDTLCGSPITSISQFHGLGNGSFDFQFLVGAGQSYRLLMSNQNLPAYVWTPTAGSPGQGPTYLTPVIGDQQTYESDWQSSCTDYGYQYGYPGC